MTSILTNIAAMAALQTLRQIDRDMETTQARVSSGLRVENAADNAAYWSIATTMRSDNSALGAVQDALGLGAATVDTAYSGMESAIEVVKEIKAKLVAATEDGVDKNKIQEEIAQLQQQLVSISEAASFSGENWLQSNLAVAGGTVTKSIVASFVREAAGNIALKTVDYTLSAATVLFDTGGNTGLLDQLHNIAGDGVVVNVNVGGTINSTNVRKFTTAEVSTQVTAATGGFDEGGKIAWTAASDGSGAGRGFVKIADDAWVRAVEQDSGVNSAQEVAATDTADHEWQIDRTATAPSVAVSVSDFKIDQTTSSERVAGLVTLVESALTAMTSAGSSLGSIQSRLDLQEGFVASLIDVIDKGIGRLVDADMNEESTRLKALQTQQQLGIQSLSIANTNAENILTLFRQ